MFPETNQTGFLCNISGKVQGVHYRASIRDSALNLKIYGWAKNLTNGSVEVVAVGEYRVVEKIIILLWSGSKYSEVSSITISRWRNKVNKGFFIK